MLAFSKAAEKMLVVMYLFAHGVPYDAAYLRRYSPIDNADTTMTTYVYGYMLRQAYFYRSRIKEMLHKFRGKFKPPLLERTECVVAHVRKGDRGIYNVNITEYCYNMSKGLPCMSRNGELGWCNTDTGCKGVPFALVNLEHVITKVPLLLGPNMRNLLVFTDDMNWLQSEIKLLKEKNLYTDWNFYYLEVPHDSLTADHVHKGWVRYGKGTESGLYLHASLALAKQCNAFIGHFGSAATSLFYHNMCHFHRGVEGICPPAYDLSKGLEFVAPK